MIKLIILMALGRRIKQTRFVSFMLKAYLVFYMVALPIVNFGQSFEWVKPYPVTYSYNPEVINYIISVDNDNHIFWGGLHIYQKNDAGAAYGDLKMIEPDSAGNVITEFID